MKDELWALEMKGNYFLIRKVQMGSKAAKLRC
jgi:hypothetical protein